MTRFLSLTAILGTLAAPAFAHATLEQQEAAADSTYRGVIRIGHGCDGAATLRVRVQIPEGVISVRPMPKAGWSLETVISDYEGSYEYYGTHSAGVTEIIWEGELLDAHYDEFIFRARITDSFEEGETIYFPTIQECPEGATQDWLEIPAEGQDPHDLDGPAPGLRISAPAGHHNH